jgi:hypothetical protein
LQGGFLYFNAATIFHKIPLAMCMLCCAPTSPLQRGIGKLHAVYIPPLKGDVRDIENIQGCKGDFFHFNAATIFYKIPLAVCTLCYALTSPSKRGIGKVHVIYISLCKGMFGTLKMKKVVRGIFIF